MTVFSASSPPSPSASPDSTSETRREKRKSSSYTRIIPSKVAKPSSRSTAWREEKELQINEVSCQFEAIEVENIEVMEKLTGLFGALALKKNKFEKLPDFKKSYIRQHFPDYFYLDGKVKDLVAQLQESKKTSEKRDRKAKYLKKLMESTKFYEKILVMRKMMSEKLSQDINSNFK